MVLSEYGTFIQFVRPDQILVKGGVSLKSKFDQIIQLSTAKPTNFNYFMVILYS